MTAFGATITGDEARTISTDVNANADTPRATARRHRMPTRWRLANVDMAKMAQAIADDVEAIKKSGVAEEVQIEQETSSLVAFTEKADPGAFRCQPGAASPSC